MLLARIKVVLFAVLLNTSSESKFVNSVMYKHVSRRLDGLLMTITEVVGRLDVIEQRLRENQQGKCTSCEKPDKDERTSYKVTDNYAKEELVILKRAFATEKKHLKEFVKFIEEKIKTKMYDSIVESVTELKHKVNLLENEKEENTLSEEMQGKVNTVERSLNSVQSFTNDLRKRTEMVESKMTEMQDSSLYFRDRLTEIEDNVSTIMENNKRRKVSFTAQLRPPDGKYAIIYPKNKIIIFSHVFYNDGDGFNDTSGVFTVPVSGVYQFIFFVEGWKVEEDDKCADAVVLLFVDGNSCEISAVAEPWHAGQNIQAGNAYINYFTKGQRVYLGTAQPCETFILFGYRTTFSGTLLY